ncbi:hypothetical protein AB205_0033660 [Aquarana catesbeiana]|uniref:Uncharacterized protein n=1 Tax=Aquarana catesbeiana TaxID=8400 RepID=A0A2G9NAX0_AQUCT|nr:hypothetical protein AB205_0033660 [Aquarana catesbeiana]
MLHIHISVHKYLCAKYTFCFHSHREEKICSVEYCGTSGCGGRRGGRSARIWHHNRSVSDTTDSGDVQVVVPKSSHFTSDSAQWLIQEIMYCSHDLDLIKEKTKEIEQRLKNLIHVLGRI